MTESKTIELEIVNSPDDKLVKYADKTGLEKPATATLVEAFRPIFAKARAAIDDARGVAESVKDATCVKEIRKSRACRLAIRAVRLESESTRKKQKEHALLYGRAVDGFHNILLADLSPVETALQEAEDIAERAEAARKAALKLARESELNPVLETPFMGDLSDLSEHAYAKTLADAKLLRQAKIDAAAKAEAEKQAAAAKAEREAAEKKLAEERAAAEAAAKAAAEKARKEREAIEAKARAEREAAEAAALKEQKRLEAIAEEERKKVAAAEAQAEALREAEAKRIADAAAAAAEEKRLAEAAARKAAAAPDKAKIQAFADSLRELPLPILKTKQVLGLLPAKIEELAVWVESQIARL